MLKLVFLVLTGAVAIIVFSQVQANQLPASVADEAAADTVADRMALPPERQSITNGDYRLEIVGEAGWRSPIATATLYAGDTLLWEKQLPHQYGPRFALVGATGQVVLFDEYINVASPYAIALIDPTGEDVATHSFDDIQAFLKNVSRADLVRGAASGWWISNPPELTENPTESEQIALVETGGTTLQVNLSTGKLSRRDDL